MTTRGPAFIGVLVGVALLAGCRESGGTGGEDEPIGTVSLAILGVPSTVRCIRVVTTGTSTVTNNLDVTPLTSSANLSLGRLPLGDVVFTGSAFGYFSATSRIPRAKSST